MASREYRLAHPEKIETIRKCGRTYHAQNREDINRKHREHYLEVRERVAIRQKAYRLANPEKVAAAKARSKANKRDEYRLKQRKYYLKIKDRQASYYRERYKNNRKEILTACKAYYLKHPERWLVHNQKRRARRVSAKADTNRQAILAFYKNARDAKRMSCYWCGHEVPKKLRHIDHVIPLAKGGADSIFNLCCSCASCNLSKGARLPENFTRQFELNFSL